MQHPTRYLAGATLVLLSAFLFSGTAGAVVVPHATTYTVTFTEVGLAKGTSWSVTFNSVTTSSKTANISFKSIAAGTNYYWSSPGSISAGTGVQYITGQTSGYMTVPNLRGQVVLFAKQYLVSVAPSSYGEGYAEPIGSNWFNAGQVYPIQAYAYTGYAFSGWTTTAGAAHFANKSAPTTLMTVQGTGSVTANLKVLNGKVVFQEVGLPANTTWSVQTDSSTFSGSSSAITVSKLPTGSYSYYVPPVAAGTGTQYAPSFPNGGSGSYSVPWVSQVTVVFVKQYQVGFFQAGGGYVLPYNGYTTWVTNGTSVALNAQGTATKAFSNWTSSTAKIAIAKKSSDGTSALVTGTGNVTANFVNGTHCTVCSVTFTAVGLPHGFAWGVSVYNGTGWVYYTSSTSTVTVSNITTSISWAVYTVLSSAPGVGYAPGQTGGYLSVPYELSQTIDYYAVYQVGASPSLAGPGVSVPGAYLPTWFLAGATVPIVSILDDYTSFHGWTSSSKLLKLASKKAASTTFTVGTTGTIVGNFRTLVSTVTFEEVGLPAGTAWSVTFNGQTYQGSGSSINITGVPAGSYYWSPVYPISSGSPKVVYDPTVAYGQAMNTEFQTVGLVNFYKAYLVSFATSGKSGGSVSPYYASYYAAGTLLPIEAIDGTSANFSAWSSSASGLTISNATSAYAYATVNAAGTLTAKFV